MLKPKATSLQTYTDGWGSSWALSDRRLTEEKQHIIMPMLPAVLIQDMLDMLSHIQEVEQCISSVVLEDR